MSPYRDKIAIVTGAASGIGRALTTELIARGAIVWACDIDRNGLETLDEPPGTRLHRAVLDVTDAGAVEQTVDRACDQAGGVDYMFNNAGIAVFGEARDMSREDWEHLVNVNIRGVIHGVAATYPRMVQRGTGHIVNTASAAGLAPTPGGTGYSMTKHAVVGLSTSLRVEAAQHGVKVSVICPGFIDTPIIQSSKLLHLDRETLLEQFPFKLHSPDDLARAVLDGVAKNRPIITYTGLAAVLWRLYRASPSLVLRALTIAHRRSPYHKGNGRRS